MNKRQGLITILAAVIGIISRRAYAQATLVGGDNPTGGFTIQSGGGLLELKPLPLNFDLDGFSDFTITQGGQAIKFTPAELMAALKSP